MGKGLNKRKRAKLVEAAKDGNLHKAQWGKASGTLKPPKAPSKDDYSEHIPASLRRLIAAKALAEQQEKKKKERMEVGLGAKTSGQEGSQVQQQPSKLAQEWGNSRPRKRAPAQENIQDDGRTSTSGRREASKPIQNTFKSASAPREHKVYKLNAFDEAPGSKKTTERKKTYYLKRKLKKKEQKLKGKPDAELTPAELKLRAQQDATKASFGEVASAPLKVNLKRKHWTADNANQGERMAKIQKEQLSRAERQASGQQQQQQQQQKGHGNKKEKQSISRKSKSVPAEVGGGLLHKARMQQAVFDKEAAREAVVQAYRQQKQQHPAGAATMASLGKLARQGEERLKQQQQQQQQT